MRILGLDYGDKNIGVALSDPTMILAYGLETIRRKDKLSVKKSVNRIGELIKEYEVDLVILGYPKNMDNSEGFRCKETVLFKERLERNFKKIPILLWDERLSSVGGTRNILHLTDKKQKNIIDEVSAVFILQGYLDFLKNNEI